MALDRRGGETIAAIATGTGGGVGIVRISGPAAGEILARLVRPWPKHPPSHKLHLGTVRHPDSGEVLDEVLACLMRAPRSYTGEDVAELQGHGGARVLEGVLAAVLAVGARLARPGEFTRRAFEAGRIDLTRAEAVAELIGARSDRALRAAQALRTGALGREIVRSRTRLVTALAELEGAIDFPEDVSDNEPEAETGRALAELAARMEGLALTYRPHLSGAEVALVGRTNAGKSSLFNALLGEERALVDPAPGTTRDAVEAELELGGLAVRLVDTAGERSDEEEAGSIERRGMELGRARRDRANAVVLVVDGSEGFGARDRALWEKLAPATRLIAWNKADLGAAARDLPEGAMVVVTSARSGVGVAELGQAIARALGEDDREGGALAVTRRQRESLLDAAASLRQAASLLEHDGPGDLAATEGRRALHHLGRVTGETLDAEVLDAIFARFCIGK